MSAEEFCAINEMLDGISLPLVQIIPPHFDFLEDSNDVADFLLNSHPPRAIYWWRLLNESDRSVDALGCERAECS